MYQEKYSVVAGPEGFISPAAAMMGVELPDRGQALIEGEITSQDQALSHIAKKLLGAKNPVIFPGPLLLWNWSKTVGKKAALIKELAQECNAKVIPMADYRPKYPKINPEVEINPNHPNITIWHNEIDVCIFVGVHCHYANVALKLIRAGTNCYTIALCAEAGHEDAMVSLRDVDENTIDSLLKTVKAAKTND
ncbi:carbon monoxide dehydrogenase beta subunit family protein [Chitinispirillales bacterium ANBcel5]|uniref:carbon monoxide dehydrogenase beta subunit family protein n=1 Tax=Cellulosispirillum alkaliphilum TaxID=3039283 RepID=UPI002A586741|nr:carbon monoxide dehydrogenase beta subunit family protein [Chitinispirillales bacterium ANBcel5]